MSTKPYPSYKDSGVEWLGRIPAQWRVKRLRFAATVNPSKTELRGRSGDTVLSFLPMERIGEDGSLDLGETRRLDQVAQGFTYFRDGDVLVAKITPCFENGKGGICRGLVGGVGFGTTELHVLRPLAEIDSAFLFYITKSTAFRWFGMITMYGAAGQQRVSEEFIRDFGLPLPKMAEQQAIADFLHRETGRIDALVKKKERLLELLQEQRTALISHAVTQGLDPNAPKKDSGIPWIGHIPKHWEVRRLKFLLHRIDQGWSPVCANHPAENGQWGVLKAGCANGGVFDPTENKTLPDGIEPPLGIEVKSGDVLMSRASGSTELVGSVAIVRGDPQSRLLLSDKTFRLVLCIDKIEPELVVWAMGSPVLRHQISEVTSGAEGLASNIAKGDIYNLVLPLPPRNEQQELCARIGDETAKIDALMAKVRTAIERLQEYRTALISAAVTGQIDVRKEAA